MTRVDATYGVIAAVAVFLIGAVSGLGGSLVTTGAIAVITGVFCAAAHMVVYRGKDRE